MAKVGKRSRAERKRSKAAKKGWETRRKNAERATYQAQAARADRKDPYSRAVQDQSMRTMMTQAGLKVPKRISHAKLLERFLDFVGQQRIEARDRIALAEAGRARAEEQILKQEKLLPIVANRAIKETVIRMHEIGAIPEGWEDDDYHIIRSRMSMAAQVGDPSEEAERLADEYNMQPREIFTIWLSP